MFLNCPENFPNLSHFRNYFENENSIGNYEKSKNFFGNLRIVLANVGKFAKIFSKIWKIFYSKKENWVKFIVNDQNSRNFFENFGKFQNSS